MFFMPGMALHWEAVAEFKGRQSNAAAFECFSSSWFFASLFECFGQAQLQLEGCTEVSFRVRPKLPLRSTRHCKSTQ